MSFRFFAETPFYEVQELLGESLLSEVYLGYRHSKGFKIPVVIKLFHQKKGAFLQMESLLRARSGAHLVRVLSFETFQSRPALIMEYIEGVSLKALMSKGGFSEEERACLCAQVLEGLKELRKAGLSHGDLSLSNILINRKGHLYLTDYGLANYSQGLYGTEPFVAPELSQGQSASFASDLFSLGVLEKVLQGANHSALKSEHFVCEGSALLDPNPHHRREKSFSFSAKAFSSLSERVAGALFIKNCLPSPVPKGEGFWEGSIKKGRAFQNSFLALAMCLLVFLVNPFISYGQYEPREQKPAILYVRSQEWIYVQIAGASGYTPLTVSVREPGLYKLKWKKKKSQGIKYVYLTAGQKTALKDKDFP